MDGKVRCLPEEGSFAVVAEAREKSTYAGRAVIVGACTTLSCTCDICTNAASAKPISTMATAIYLLMTRSGKSG